MKVAILLKGDDDIVVKLTPETEREKKMLELLDHKVFSAELSKPAINQGQIAPLSETYLSLIGIVR